MLGNWTVDSFQTAPGSLTAPIEGRSCPLSSDRQRRWLGWLQPVHRHLRDQRQRLADRPAGDHPHRLRGRVHEPGNGVPHRDGGRRPDPAARASDHPHRPFRGHPRRPGPTIARIGGTVADPSRRSPTATPTPAPTPTPRRAPSPTPAPRSNRLPRFRRPPPATSSAPMGSLASIVYPADWSTVTEPADLACRYFDPEPITGPGRSRHPRHGGHDRRRGYAVRRCDRPRCDRSCDLGRHPFWPTSPSMAWPPSSWSRRRGARRLPAMSPPACPASRTSSITAPPAP